jgi:hypothetical protein
MYPCSSTLWFGDYGLVNKVAEEGGSSAQETGGRSRYAYYILKLRKLISRDAISFSEISIWAYEELWISVVLSMQSLYLFWAFLPVPVCWRAKRSV